MPCTPKMLSAGYTGRRTGRTGGSGNLRTSRYHQRQSDTPPATSEWQSENIIGMFHYTDGVCAAST
ncbi:MAG: hypothetical protein ACSLEN_03700 [Candidatus Malihini olakiniferum]